MVGAKQQFVAAAKQLEVSRQVYVEQALLRAGTGGAAEPLRTLAGRGVDGAEGKGALGDVRVVGLGIADVEFPVIGQLLVELGEVLV
ncbi:hypothetical protein D3C80_1820480 [compost metagenome]